jgi:hypothetical protein
MNTAAALARLCLLGLLFVAAHPAGAQGSAPAMTPAEAYQRGCAECHRRESSVLRAIPSRPEAERRAWIERFMAQHPCACDEARPLIVDYLLERTRR